ncbi:MAG: hypothetical protein CL857_05410 [Cryomorphaceae bacterium]|nr:hypothetical protein [Cryomorphaceae bacterium]|tara:strand:+ start:1161 stop:1682 length:522 start_codon:yes stop_codon:yes gene_type:complete
MLRDYKTGVKQDVRIFSGKEIEHTPAFGLQTLFLARNDLTFDQIIELAKKVNAKAIYFGANRTFMHNIANTQQLLKKLMDKGYWCTIDYQYSVHAEVKERFKDIWNEEKFIPFCSIIFENSEDDKRLCFKIDDVDFNHSNKGVWVMSMQDFKNQAGHTKWEEYKQDEPIEEKI